MPRLYVGITDRSWYEQLSQIPQLDEANFWQPSGGRGFHVLSPGELFLFKLHAPDNAIVGGGFFVKQVRVPVTVAWEWFDRKNGVASEEEMLARVARYVPRSLGARLSAASHQLGCILLAQPFFFERAAWIPQPEGWGRSIQQGRSYDLSEEMGRRLLAEVQLRLAGDPVRFADEAGRYGPPTLVQHRLGQGLFRAAVTDAYQRECAVTNDRVLYVLQAAHIRPYALGGSHEVRNGLLLRSDLHTLFDRGYLGVDDDHRLLVSRRLRDEFDNGRDYYALEGRRLTLPARQPDRPDPDLLRWHRREVFDAA